MAQAPILGAGGIVVRGGEKPLIAVVQRRKDNAWVLPKGKLKNKESAIAAAEREVMEETGQDVTVHEFLGAVSYKAGGKPKVVQFWRMRATDGPPQRLAKDIKAVKWLPLDTAIKKLGDPLEQLFLRNVGERALAAIDPIQESAMAAMVVEPTIVSEPIPHPIEPFDEQKPTASTLPIVEPSIAAELLRRDERTLLPELLTRPAAEPLPVPTVLELPAASPTTQANPNAPMAPTPIARRAADPVVRSTVPANPTRNLAPVAAPSAQATMLRRVLRRLQREWTDASHLVQRTMARRAGR